MKKNIHCLTVFAVLLLFPSTIYSHLPEGDADLILFNGKIITVDKQDNIYQAIAVKNGKILGLGNNDVIKPLAGINCRLIDLKGKTVTPGLIDSHYHMMYYGQQYWQGYLNIRHPDVKSKADLLKVVGDRAKQLQKDEWISGNQGFHLALNETLDRWDLDKVSPVNPVYLRQGSGQYAVVNSRALEIAGITKNTPNPPSSLIVRDNSGEPTGVLSHYPAENLVAKFASGYGNRTVEQKIEDIEKGQKLCLEAGYTSIQDVIIGNTDDIEIFQNYANSGRLKVRLYTMLYLNTEEQVNNVAQNYKPANSGLFTFGGWKLAMDGGTSAKTILMYDTTLYISEICYPYFSQEVLNRMVNTLHNTGLQVAVHVSGDRGIDMTLTAFEEAMKKNPRPDPRHRIEHGYFPSSSALQRMKTSKIILSTQPQWISWHGDVYVQGSDSATIALMLPLKTMLGMGIPVAFGCDVPASIYQEPKYAFTGSIFRRTPSGVTLNSEQRLTPQEALRVHTLGSAYASFSENMTGTLEPGKFADMVVWSHDLYTMFPVDYINLKSEMTIVNGAIEYNSGILSVTTNISNSFNDQDGFLMMDGYPNPFHYFTSFRINIPVSLTVELNIYDEMGNKVNTLENRRFEPGSHTVYWNGTDNQGREVSTGLYLCRLRSGKFISQKKVIRIKYP
jgi:predicted amidohydrolase YtcJ